MDFTSNYLGILKKTGKISDITDADGIPITTIKISPEPKLFTYSPPKITYDKFKQRKIVVEPDIKRIYSLEGAKELGIEIVSVSVDSRTRWMKRQSVRYELKRAGLSREENILRTMPLNHYIEWDRANHLVRLCGKNCRSSGGIKNVTDWLELR